jgi:hypothetical protein
MLNDAVTGKDIVEVISRATGIPLHVFFFELFFLKESILLLIERHNTKWNAFCFV